MINSEPPYKLIESWLFSYDEWKTEITIIQEKLDNISGLTAHYDLVPIHGTGQTSERIFHQVLERLKVKERELPVLQTRIRLLDKAIQGLNEEERKFVELKYRQQIGNFYIMNRLEWTHRMFYLRRKEILAKIHSLGKMPRSGLRKRNVTNRSVSGDKTIMDRSPGCKIKAL